MSTEDFFLMHFRFTNFHDILKIFCDIYSNLFTVIYHSFKIRVINMYVNQVYD